MRGIKVLKEADAETALRTIRIEETVGGGAEIHRSVLNLAGDVRAGGIKSGTSDLPMAIPWRSHGDPCPADQPVTASVSGGGTIMPFFERGGVRIHYEEAGSGYPLLVIPGGGLNSTIGFHSGSAPFNTMTEFSGEFRCITMDLRNANGGQSSGPLEIDRPWDAHTDDHLALMDHLGIQSFMVIGFCIGGPFIWNLLRRAPNRVIAAVLAQPSGHRVELPDQFHSNNMKSWGPDLCARRPDITMPMVDAFLTKMYRANPDFVFTVTRDFVRACQTPVLILPDDVPPHPYAVAMESAMLAPQSEVSLYPWKDPKDRIPLAVRHVRSFLRAHKL